jgi:hypothetical protein
MLQHLPAVVVLTVPLQAHGCVPAGGNRTSRSAHRKRLTSSSFSVLVRRRCCLMHHLTHVEWLAACHTCQQPGAQRRGCSDTYCLLRWSAGAGLSVALTLLLRLGRSGALVDALSPDGVPLRFGDLGIGAPLCPLQQEQCVQQRIAA